MYNTNPVKEFKLNVKLIISALKTKNNELIKACQETLSTQFGTDYLASVMTSAVFQLAETDPDLFSWTWQHFYELDACLDLIEQSIMFAVKRLIKKGFILGKDFSTTFTGEILITREAKEVLMESGSCLDHIFLEEILQIID